MILILGSNALAKFQFPEIEGPPSRPHYTIVLLKRPPKKKEPITLGSPQMDVEGLRRLEGLFRLQAVRFQAVGTLFGALGVWSSWPLRS